MLRKRSSQTMIGICCLLLFMPIPASAEDSPQDKGKMDWKIDRIIQGESEEERHQTETELEKRLPELFDEETKVTIQSVQKENKESVDDLKDSLFAMDFEADATIDDTKEALFTSEYVAPKSSSNHDDDEEGGNSWFNNVLLAGLTGLGCIVFGGIYVMFRKLSD